MWALCTWWAAGRGLFTAAVEVAHQQLSISFMHHMAVQRNVQNPFEDKGEPA